MFDDFIDFVKSFVRSLLELFTEFGFTGTGKKRR